MTPEIANKIIVSFMEYELKQVRGIVPRVDLWYDKENNILPDQDNISGSLNALIPVWDKIRTITTHLDLRMHYDTRRVINTILA